MTGLVPAAVLAAAQAVASASLDIPGCQVQRKSVTVSTYGHQVETFATIATVNAGMAKPSAGVMAVYTGLIGTRESWVVSLPLGTTVARDDQLLINGLTLRVEADLTQSSYSTLTQALVTVIR